MDDNTIQAHVSAIRRALGADRGMLLTIPGRGYRVSGAWSIRRDGVATGRTVAAPSPNGARSAANNLPAAVSDLIGRDKILRRVQDLLSGYRVVTLCGVGGIGKTRLAVEVGGRQPGRDCRCEGAGPGAWRTESAASVDRACHRDATPVAAAG